MTDSSIGNYVGPSIGRLARPTEDNDPPTAPPNDARLPPRLPLEGDADARVLLGQRIGGGGMGDLRCCIGRSTPSHGLGNEVP